MKQSSGDLRREREKACLLVSKAIAALNVAVHANRIAVEDMPRMPFPLIAPAQEALSQIP
jgi:hypothetical protein